MKVVERQEGLQSKFREIGMLRIFVGTGWAQNGHKVLRNSAKYRKRKGQEGQSTRRDIDNYMIYNAKRPHLSMWPLVFIGAGNGIRTRDFNLGKVALYH
jgi:hypothetical protein